MEELIIFYNFLGDVTNVIQLCARATKQKNQQMERAIKTKDRQQIDLKTMTSLNIRSVAFGKTLGRGSDTFTWLLMAKYRVGST